VCATSWSHPSAIHHIYDQKIENQEISGIFWEFFGEIFWKFLGIFWKIFGNFGNFLTYFLLNPG
jgi:hypothetical protein